MTAHNFILNTWEAGQDYKFKTSLAYTLSSRTARPWGAGGRERHTYTETLCVNKTKHHKTMDRAPRALELSHCCGSSRAFPGWRIWSDISPLCPSFHSC